MMQRTSWSTTLVILIVMPSQVFARQPTLVDQIGTWSSEVFARSTRQQKLVFSSVVQRLWGVCCMSNVTCTASQDLISFGGKRIFNRTSLILWTESHWSKRTPFCTRMEANVGLVRSQPSYMQRGRSNILIPISKESSWYECTAS